MLSTCKQTQNAGTTSQVEIHVSAMAKYIYNIPRACLLNRSPVPAMDLKSNRSGL